MESGLRKNEIVTALTRSEHGALTEYVPLAKLAAFEDGEFLAHLIAWDRKNGQIRDSKIALPVTSLCVRSFDGEMRENSLAHLLMLDPRSLVKAVRLARDPLLQIHSQERKRLYGVVEQYLRVREAAPRRFEAAAMQHRGSMKELYAFCRVRPNQYADQILFKGKKLGIFRDIANLKTMPALEAAGLIMRRRIPFLTVQAAMGARMKEEEVVLALLSVMSPTEVVTNTKMFERLGIKTNPALRAAFEAALGRVASSKAATFKTTRAAEAMTDGRLRDKLRGVQEKQLARLGGIEGDWLVLGDKSGSMESAIEASRVLAATLAKMVRGKVHLVFFDVTPRYINATGKDYDQILAETKNIRANGGTSIGCGLQLAIDRKLEVQGIAIVSDSAENCVPMFVPTYAKYAQLFGNEPPVYLYKLEGETTNALEVHMIRAKLDLQVFDLRGGFDFYSLPNIVQTMRVSRYGLIDDIMETPLATRDQVLKGEEHGSARQAA